MPFYLTSPTSWLLSAIACFLVLLLNVSPANAAIVENIAIGNAKAIALGNAVTADPPGIDAIHFNPAGLVLLDGRRYQFKLLAAAYNFRVEFGDHDAQTQAVLDQYGYQDEVANSTSENSAIGSKVPFKRGVNEWPLPVLVMPFSGASYRPPGSRFTFATAVYSPLASGYIRPPDDPGRFLGQEMAITKITYLSPSIAVELTPDFAVGVSLGMSWQGLGAVNQFRVPNISLVVADQLVSQLREQNLCPAEHDPNPYIDLCGGRVGPYTEIMELTLDTHDDFVPNVNLGLLSRPYPWFSWGAVYQSESVAHTKGEYQITYRDEWVDFFSAFSGSRAWQGINALYPLPSGKRQETGTATVDLVLPEHFATGISLWVTPSFKLNLDVRRSKWQSWESLDIQFDNSLDFLKLAALFGGASVDQLSLPRGYKNVWNWGLGLEYRYRDGLAFRFGYEPRKSSIPLSKQDVLLPLGDAELFGLGIMYQPTRRQTFELGFGYLRASASVPAGTSSNANSSDQNTNIVYNPYAGTDFRSEVKACLLELSYLTYF